MSISNTIQPKLSIIVPTRERSDTLIHTLKTIITQDYPNLEIIISDNFSQDNTKDVVDSFSDKRIKYINTGCRVSMSDNWEFALSYATGEYITFIGDDDGLIPNSILNVVSIISKKNPDAFVWQKIEYCWPDYIIDNMKNWMSIKKIHNNLINVHSDNKLKKVMMFYEAYNKLPCLYNSFVKTSKINEVKKLSKNGKFFNSISPDVYSGIVLSKVIKSYLYSDYPISINGASRHSNGTSFVRHSDTDKNTPSEKFKSENTRIYDNRILTAPCVNVCVMGEYLLAMEHILKTSFTEPYWKHYISSMYRSAKSSYLSEEILKSVKHTCSSLNVKYKQTSQTKNVEFKSNNIGFQVDTFNFNIPISMVKNVFDASLFVEKMLPSEMSLETSSPFSRMINCIYRTLINELKTYYREI